MKHRSPLSVFFLSLLTLGIYSLIWHVKTKNELNKLGAEIPTAWLLIVPFANIYWLWKYSQGVEKVTNGKISLVLCLILLLLLSIVGIAILQSQYNDLGNVSAAGQPPAPVPGMGPMPDVFPAPQSFAPPAPAAPMAASAIYPDNSSHPEPPTPAPMAPVAAQPTVAPTAPEMVQPAPIINPAPIAASQPPPPAVGQPQPPQPPLPPTTPLV